MEIQRFAGPEELSRAAAEEFCRLAKGGRFRVALAGGSTPRRLYELLSAEPFRSRVDWNHVDFFWGDERAVPPDHPESNFRMAHEAMLAPLQVPERKIHRVPAERSDPQSAAWEYEAELIRMLGSPPKFDLVLLGMGTDGHTASLFPNTPALQESERWFVVNPVEKLSTQRFTLTAQAINLAERILFLVSGSQKADVLSKVLEGPRNSEEYPSQGIQGNVVWYVDEQAGAALTPA